MIGRLGRVSAALLLAVALALGACGRKGDLRAPEGQEDAQRAERPGRLRLAGAAVGRLSAGRTRGGGAHSGTVATRAEDIQARPP